jgi:hypothetical protein
VGLVLAIPVGELGDRGRRKSELLLQDYRGQGESLAERTTLPSGMILHACQRSFADPGELRKYQKGEGVSIDVHVMIQDI